MTSIHCTAQKGREMGLEEVAQAEPVRRSENDTHPIVESDTVGAIVDVTVTKQTADPNCVPKPLDPDAACGTSVYDVLIPQQFQDCITSVYAKMSCGC